MVELSFKLLWDYFLVERNEILSLGLADFSALESVATSNSLCFCYIYKKARS